MKTKKDIILRSLLFQLIFWMVSFFVLFRVFTKDYNNGTVDLIYTFLFHIPLFLAVSLNNRLIDYFIPKRRYIAYSLSVIFIIFLGCLLHSFIFDILAGYVFPDYYFISMFSVFEIAQYLLAYIVISFLLTLSKNWFELREKQSELERRNQEVQLQNLKSQLNPHFLFNSLNNIYALTDSSDPRSKEYLIKLSDSLRYMLYQTNEDSVALKDEIEYLKNYIALEELRLEDAKKIKVDYTIDDPDTKIAPLLLLTLVENAFKHADRTDPEIEISITQNKNILELQCRNNILADQSIRNSGGIGLENLRKRLELIYPSRYKFETENTQYYYSCKLTIDL